MIGQGYTMLKYVIRLSVRTGIIFVAIALSACSNDKNSDKTTASIATEDTAGDSRFSAESISRGAALFQENCAECHGPEAQGHPDWSPDRKTDAVLFVAAPPLDGTGLTWKRKREEISKIITNGVRRNKKVVMPAWKGRVKPSEVEDVITWIQALWPPEIYDRWHKAQSPVQSVKKKVPESS